MGTEAANNERRNNGTTVAIIVLTALAGLALTSCGVGVFVLPPAIQQVREARRRQEVAENLRKLSLALKNYDQKHARPVETIEPLSESQIRETAVRLKDEWLKEQPDVKTQDAKIANIKKTADGWDVTFEGLTLPGASAGGSGDCLHIHIAPDGKLIRAVRVRCTRPPFRPEL